MAYNNQLANRIRDKFADFANVEEKEMMGGLTFMYNGKMCVGIFRGELMCRISPAEYDNALEQVGCTAMQFKGRIMKGYVLINDAGIATQKQFDYWINLALAFNSSAKASAKKKK